MLSSRFWHRKLPHRWRCHGSLLRCENLDHTMSGWHWDAHWLSRLLTPRRD